MERPSFKVPEVLLRFSCGVGICERGVGCVWVGQHALLLAGFERNVFAVAIYLVARGLLTAHNARN
jgi:hypothetical protein